MKSFLFGCGILIMLYITYRVYKLQTLDSGLDRLVKNGAVIIDVRTEKEFKTGHISGSENISLGTIRERYMELDPAKTYITVCSHGLRSVKAEHILKEKGFKHVYNGGAYSDLQNYLKRSGIK